MVDSVIKQNKPSQIYKDFDLSFARNLNTNDVARKTDVAAVKQALKVLIRTQYYEKPFQPQFGSPLAQLLFEPADITTASLIASEIKQVIDNYEKRARVEGVVVNPQPDANSFTAKISFYVLGIQRRQELDIVLERLR